MTLGVLPWYAATNIFIDLIIFDIQGVSHVTDL